MKNSRIEYLLSKASSLPKRPGVYLMKDASGKVIYVGKSKVLKNRVSQYFHSGTHGIKTDRMVRSVFDFDYILCDTEIEALALENTKIKQYEPKYNIKLKDDKSYPYIELTREEFPKLIITRKRKQDGGLYFGPYSSAQTARKILKTVGAIYGFPSCNKVFPRDIGKSRPCLNSQIGRCLAPCSGNITAEEYRTLTDGVQAVLKGDITNAKRLLEEKMMQAAENLAFEAAAKYRDRISALESLYKRQKVVAELDADYDIIGIYRGEPVSVISLFYVRGGIISDTENFNIGSVAIDGDDEIESFLCGIYEKRGSVPREVLISDGVFEENAVTLPEYLAKIRGKSVTVTYPQKGKKKELCRLVSDNARQYALQYEAEAVKNDTVLLELAKALALQVIPERIECYDISNYGDDNITAGMIVCENATLKKSDYRVFNIKNGAGQDDYASMREALERRMRNHAEKTHGFEKLPDLILLDGGEAHVNTVKKLFIELGYDIPVFGMVKDEFHKTRGVTNGYDEISLSRTDTIFVFLYKLQEEVHRFTITKMKNAKRKTLKSSHLTNVKGVGQKKAEKIFEKFETLESLKSATVEQIEEVNGINRTTAEAIYAFLHEGDKK